MQLTVDETGKVIDVKLLARPRPRSRRSRAGSRAQRHASSPPCAAASRLAPRSHRDAFQAPDLAPLAVASRFFASGYPVATHCSPFLLGSSPGSAFLGRVRANCSADRRGGGAAAADASRPSSPTSWRRRTPKPRRPRAHRLGRGANRDLGHRHGRRVKVIEIGGAAFDRSGGHRDSTVPVRARGDRRSARADSHQLPLRLRDQGRGADDRAV